MPQEMRIGGPIWMTIWAIAILQTLVGGITPAEAWRHDIQYPGIVVALLLLWFLGSALLFFGVTTGGILFGAVTIITNALIYAGLFTLVLLVRRM